MTAITILQELIDTITDNGDDDAVYAATVAAARIASHAAAAEPDDFTAQRWDFASLSLEHAAAALRHPGTIEAAVHLDPITAEDLPEITTLLHTLLTALLESCGSPAVPAAVSGRRGEAPNIAVAGLRQAAGELP
ncbi:hypothetical protein [Paractinoplanes hotanensis]|uniref:Uncharacterized protein n=1 Tax=Paractinoplanes hotanensis TaxID=2906497 RepID=A0ABT0Y825_9ACTN|nr:hypothetical protein [Actinoplanes hotanensis]MCM4082195.1 hypothetical protein [Actinoplanes hotanensis]